MTFRPYLSAGVALRDIRLSVKYSRGAFAKACRVSRSTLQLAEQGRIDPQPILAKWHQRRAA